MYPVTWKVMFNNGTITEEFSEGKETNFGSKEFLSQKSNFKSISLIDHRNNNEYVVNLENGTILIGNLVIEPAKELDGRTYSIANLPVKYNEGVIQFKLSQPVAVGVNCTPGPAAYNIGYKIKLPDNFCFWHRSHQTTAKLTHAQVLVTVSHFDESVRFSVTFTTEIDYNMGKKVMVKI